MGSYPVVQDYDAFGNLGYHGDLTTWGYAPFPPVNGKVYGKYDGWPVFVHSNALGSTGTTTFPDGSWVSSEIYDPWGQRWATSGTLYDERFGSMMKRRDPESGLDQTPNRMFTSLYGRWMSPDPLAGEITNPQSLNRYAYVMNNPTNAVDPLGLQDQSGGWNGNCTPNGYTNQPCNWGGYGPSNTMNPGPFCMSGEYGCPGTPSEAQTAEAQYDARVAVAFLQARGYKYGTDQNGAVYLWMAGSQVCASNDGASVGCGSAVKGQWTKVSDLDYESQAILSLQMVGFMSGSMTDSRTYVGWTGSAAAAGYLIAPAAYKEASLGVLAAAEQYGIPATTLLYSLYRWGWTMGRTPPVIGPTLRWIGQQYRANVNGPGC